MTHKEQTVPRTGRTRYRMTDFVMFGVMSVLATIQDWSAADLVWSMWAASLVVNGGMLLILALFVQVMAAVTALREKGSREAITNAVILLAFAFALAGVFLGFHLVHVGLLADIVPALDEETLRSVRGQTFATFAATLRHCLGAYSTFLQTHALYLVVSVALMFRTKDVSPLGLPFTMLLKLQALMLVLTSLYIIDASPLFRYAALLVLYLPLRGWFGETSKAATT